jgi:protein O-GlcNAc transferase
VSSDISKLIGQAMALHDRGVLKAAEELYETALRRQPKNFQALHFLGILRLQQGHAGSALGPLTAAVHANPRSADTHFGIGVALTRLDRHDEAIASFDRALAISPRRADALHNRGSALQLLGRHVEALASYDQALAIKPEHPGALYNRGRLLQSLNRHAEALRSYDKALAIRPRDADILNSKGNVLQLLNRHARAAACYDKAIALKPDSAQFFYNRGNALQALNRHEGAAESYSTALALNPQYPYAPGAAALSQAHICDWREFENLKKKLVDGIRSSLPVSSPFPFLVISDDPADQRTCASMFVRERHPARPNRTRAAKRNSADRVRLAYLSADFHEHATAYLIAELFEKHDRHRFEVLGFSFGPAGRSAMRSRLRRGFDRFVDVREKSDSEIAQMLVDAGVDIAIDLKGYTTDSRPGIFAERPAPIQVNYLGYPGTMGADFIDYIIADRTVIPDEHQRFYSEKIAYLPDCYQPNDATRAIATPKRDEFGLPRRGFVFCSFNNSYKITAPVFDVWMRLLQQVRGSVLWLLEGNAAAVANLREEAAKRGVAPERLVFAPRVELPDHLARHRSADLFLDTLPCNAHTTASDALWGGLPVLTCLGTTFAGRVAASLLLAVGLPELVTCSLNEYESLALRLANDRGLLKQLKLKLARNRLTAPLFDSDRYRRNIEAAYLQMWASYERDNAPRDIVVPASET